MRAWLNDQAWWWPIEARLSGLSHFLRGHDLHWRENASFWAGCTGDISCYTCPDSSDGKSDVSIWCRSQSWLRKVAMFVCAILGHDELRHPQRSIGWDDEKNEGIYVDLENEWYCYRCGADID